MIIYWFALVLSSFIMCDGYVQRDCTLSHWSAWSKCSYQCSKGESTRFRNVTQDARGVFAKACHKKRFDNKECGNDNNGCQMLCEKETGNCHCKSGYELGSDKKKCFNANECFLNNGHGACSQKCTDTEGSYICSCNDGFKLAPDGHDCIYNASVICSNKLHLQSSEPQKKCICKNGLDGVKCDRNLSFCLNKHNCQQKNDLCLTFTLAKNHCLNPNFQIPILLKMTHSEYQSGKKKSQVEEYIENMLEGDTNGKSLDNLRGQISPLKRNILYYVESLTDVRVKSSFTYAKFGIIDMIDNFRSIKMDTICPLIKSSDIRCITDEDCDILREDGHSCPSIIRYANQLIEQTSNTNPKIKSWVYILISGFAIIIVLLIILLFLYLKRGKHSNSASAIYNNNMSQPIIFNTEYNTLPQRDTIESWNNDPHTFSDLYLDDATSFEAGNKLYDNDNDSLYKSDEIPIYESIDNLKAGIDEQCSSLPSKNNLNNYDEPRYLIPRKIGVDPNIKGDSCESFGECSGNEGKSSSKLAVDISGVDETRYACPQSNKEVSSCSQLVVDISGVDETKYACPQSNMEVSSCSKMVVDLTAEEEPRYSTPPGRN